MKFIITDEDYRKALDYNDDSNRATCCPISQCLSRTLDANIITTMYRVWINDVHYFLDYSGIQIVREFDSTKQITAREFEVLDYVG